MLRKKPGKYRYYCFRIDQWGKRLDEKPGIPRARSQRDALARYVDYNVPQSPEVEFSGYVVIHSPLSPAAMDVMDDKGLEDLDYDFWVYDADLWAVGPREFPVYVP